MKEMRLADAGGGEKLSNFQGFDEHDVVIGDHTRDRIFEGKRE
jgi:hypothetical protein